MSNASSTIPTRAGRSPALARLRARPALVSHLVISLVLVLLAVYFVMPLYWLLIAATKTSDQLVYSPLWFSGTFHLFQNIGRVFALNGGEFLIWIRNSIIYAVPITLLVLGNSSLAGFALAKYRFRGRTAMLLIVLVVMMVPQAALVLPLYLEMIAVHQVNTFQAVILPSALYPFGVYLLYIYYDTEFPTELMLAARVDGASEFRLFWNIALPAASGMLSAVALLTFVLNWNNYFLPFVMLSSDNLLPLPVGLGNWAGSLSFGTGNGSSGLTQIVQPDILIGGVLAVLPIAVLFIVLQRYFVRGFMAGSIRG